MVFLWRDQSEGVAHFFLEVVAIVDGCVLSIQTLRYGRGI